MRAHVVGFVLLVGGLLASCATVRTVVADARHCAEPQLAQRLPALIPVVLAVLDTGTSSVHESAMSALEVGIDGGRDVLVCAVDAILGQLETIKPKLPAEFKRLEPPPLETRARAFLASRGFAHRAPLGAP